MHNPYNISEKQYDHYLISGQTVGLVVGDVPNPFFNTYQVHLIVDSGWRGYADGAYKVTATINNEKV